MKNWGMSVKDKLKNIKNKTGENFNDLIRQYVQERFLARLEKSAHKDSFILKGGILFLVWTGLKYRPTKDLDFMYRGMIEKGTLVQKIKDVWTISIPEDGVEFIEESLRCEEIKEEHEYGGVRLLFDCKVANIKVLMQLDVCTGDKITPHVRELNFPALLSEEPPVLNTYPIETVLAEKIHAVIDLDITNSRLKDYYDLYILISELSERLNEKIVKRALITTFLHRELTLPATPIKILSEYCFEDSTKIAQ